ncbi:metalloregulator ArsR/SmtB family transcription factor [Paludisphaera sp.]|uniref:ArsR/SmtB family transcription factor n=1 Tax=Paludisphaera sp. TaxID=2017432 RepID=UPI00301BA2FC
MAVAKAGPKSPVSKPVASKSAAPKSAAPKSVASRAKSAKVVDQRLQQAKRASILLKHVSDPTRLQVILILSEGERHVGALCEQLSQSQPAVSHHLALLRHGNIIAPRRQGKNNFYSLTETGSELARVVKSLIAS